MPREMYPGMPTLQKSGLSPRREGLAKSPDTHNMPAFLSGDKNNDDNAGHYGEKTISKALNGVPGPVRKYSEGINRRELMAFNNQ